MRSCLVFSISGRRRMHLENMKKWLRTYRSLKAMFHPSISFSAQFTYKFFPRKLETIETLHSTTSYSLYKHFFLTQIFRSLAWQNSPMVPIKPWSPYSLHLCCLTSLYAVLLEHLVHVPPFLVHPSPFIHLQPIRFKKPFSCNLHLLVPSPVLPLSEISPFTYTSDSLVRIPKLGLSVSLLTI